MGEKRYRNSFLFKLLIFLLLLFVLDLGIGFILKKSYFKQKNSRFSKTTYILNDLSSDIIILGDSKAEHNYVPKILEDSLNLTCYNAGSDGQSIFYYKALQNGVLRRYTPKIFILDFGYEKLRYHPLDYERLSFLAPYYKTHQEIRSIIDLKSKMEKYKYLSRAYTFNSTLLITSKAFINPKIYNNGYNPLSSSMSGADLEYFNRNKPDKEDQIIFDTTAVNYYKLFLSDAQKAGIKVYVFISPTYGNMDGNEKSISYLKNITLQEGAQFYNFSVAIGSISSDYKLFADPGHLNNTGAIKYTQKVCEIIKKTVK